MIREVVYDVEKHLQDIWVLAVADKAPLMFYQWTEVPNGEHIKFFTSCVTVLDTLQGPLPIHLKLVNAKLVLMGCNRNDLENLKPHLYKKVILGAQKEYLALLALSGANNTKFGGLKDKL